MKFTFAFFNKHKRQRKKILLKQSENYLLSIIICTIITIRYNTIVFATNLVDNVDNNIIKEAILSNNLLLSKTSYRYYKVEEKAQNETIDYSSTQEELAMDSVANNYEKNVLVFNNADNYFCNVISETRNYQKLNVCGVEVINYSSNRNIYLLWMIYYLKKMMKLQCILLTHLSLIQIVQNIVHQQEH